MKRKNLCRYLFATVALVSTMSFCGVVWAAEIDPADNAPAPAVTGTATATTDDKKQQEVPPQPEDMTKPEIQEPSQDGQGEKAEPAGQAPDTQTPADTTGTTTPPVQDAAELPDRITPSIEISKEKDVYQSYEVIYVALTAPEGYTIYYSLDDSEATTASVQYTQPFAIEAPGAAGGSVTLHAIAVKSSGTR